ncbi:MAG TPA: 6-phosphogluconolactonase [Terriglobales bacterium]|nr:6-phosphogluconolactonase [Terriglobales bacterium]
MSQTAPLPANVTVAVAHDAQSANTLAADMIVGLARQAVSESRPLTIALSGGSTPRKLFESLASPQWQSKVPWGQIEFFWGDERYVPITDHDSNFRMTWEAMLSKVPVPPEHIHRWLTERPAEEAAQLQEEEIRNVVPAGSTGLPEFDLILLGLGTNGHTASLFPYQPALHEKSRLTIAEYIDEVKMQRLTFSTPLINAAKQVVFLALGADKATVVREILAGVFDPERLPAQLIRPTRGKLTWILDEESASKLPPEIATHGN